MPNLVARTISFRRGGGCPRAAPRFARAVHVRGVEEGDAPIHRHLQRGAGLGLVGRAVELGHPHAAEPHAGNVEVRLPERSLFHDRAQCPARAALHRKMARPAARDSWAAGRPPDAAQSRGAARTLRNAADWSQRRSGPPLRRRSAARHHTLTAGWSRPRRRRLRGQWPTSPDIRPSSAATPRRWLGKRGVGPHRAPRAPPAAGSAGPRRGDRPGRGARRQAARAGRTPAGRGSAAAGRRAPAGREHAASTRCGASRYEGTELRVYRDALGHGASLPGSPGCTRTDRGGALELQVDTPGEYRAVVFSRPRPPAASLQSDLAAAARPR